MQHFYPRAASIDHIWAIYFSHFFLQFVLYILRIYSSILCIKNSPFFLQISKIFRIFAQNLVRD